jgi:DnaJ-class molecular chaperone
MMRVECSECNGHGEVHYLPRFATSPECVKSTTCQTCNGSGWAEAHDEAPAQEWEYHDLEHLMIDADTHPGLYLRGEVGPAPTLKLAA